MWWLIFLLLSSSVAFAQTGTIKTPAQLNAEINSSFADNVTGAITPQSLRQVNLDIVASLGAISVSNVWTAPQQFSNVGIGGPANTMAGLFIQGASATQNDYAIFIQNSAALTLIAARDDGVLFLAGPNIGTLFNAATKPIIPCVTGSGLTGARATVTDAVTGAYGATYSGGGSLVRGVICVVGTGWIFG